MKLKLNIAVEFFEMELLVKKSATVEKILEKVFLTVYITEHKIFSLTYQDQMLEKDEKIGKYVKEKEAFLKVIPICYPPVDCKLMENPVLLTIMYNHTLEKVCEGKLIPPYEYTVKLMAIALYERHVENIEKFRNTSGFSLPMPSWATTKYNIKRKQWNDDVIVEFNKLSFDDRFQAMEEYLKVAKDAHMYGHEIFYTDIEKSSFLGLDIYGVKVCGIDDGVDYFQWNQVVIAITEDSNVLFQFSAPEKRSTIAVKLPFRDMGDVASFYAYYIMLRKLKYEKPTFNNYEMNGNTMLKFKKDIESLCKMVYSQDPLETYFTDERAESVDNLWMDEEYLADTDPRNESNDESEFTSGHYTTEYGNKYENKVQEKDENEETDETTENEFEFKESESEKYKEKGEYDDCTIEDIEREYHKREETGTKEEQGTEQLQKYMENHTGYAAAMSDSKHQSVQDQSSTLYNKEFKIPLDYELNERALQNLIIDCIDEDELIKSIKKKLKFVENTSEDKYDLDVKIEISATLMAEDFSENPKDKNNSDQGEDKNNEEAETAV
ncbi:Moesin/ezrin/radixin -like protein 1 [Trichinella spiralis]|uniref:Moesin/ezrin/radixin-like protein 1 n=1 Tax=Trichinella spiralis TaxID=6334 RepID=A0A0V1BPS8_TRISP|nr:Moesin/ezrin/radixin -like protein 1 [Trichinella spiralis]